MNMTKTEVWQILTWGTENAPIAPIARKSHMPGFVVAGHIYQLRLALQGMPSVAEKNVEDVNI